MIKQKKILFILLFSLLVLFLNVKSVFATDITFEDNNQTYTFNNVPSGSDYSYYFIAKKPDNNYLIGFSSSGFCFTHSNTDYYIKSVDSSSWKWLTGSISYINNYISRPNYYKNSSGGISLMDTRENNPYPDTYNVISANCDIYLR